MGSFPTAAGGSITGNPTGSGGGAFGLPQLHAFSGVAALRRRR
jgi:hypothetical protein